MQHQIASMHARHRKMYQRVSMTILQRRSFPFGGNGGLVWNKTLQVPGSSLSVTNEAVAVYPESKMPDATPPFLNIFATSWIIDECKTCFFFFGIYVQINALTSLNLYPSCNPLLFCLIQWKLPLAPFVVLLHDSIIHSTFPIVLHLSPLSSKRSWSAW